MPLPTQFTLNNTKGVPGAAGPQGLPGPGFATLPAASVPNPGSGITPFIDSADSYALKSKDSNGVLREIQYNRIFDVRSPKYGAVGDGVTDDTAAIVAALAAAKAAGGGTLFFPRGIYACSATLNLQGSSAPIVVDGESASTALVDVFQSTTWAATPLTTWFKGSWIRYTGTTSLFTVSGSGACDGLSIRRIGLFTNNQSGVGNNTIAFDVESNPTRFLMDHVHICNFGTGISTGNNGAGVPGIETSSFNHVSIYGCTVGVLCNGANTTNLTFFNNWYSACGKGVSIKQGSGLYWHGGVVQGCVTYGVEIVPTANITGIGFEGMWWEQYARGTINLRIDTTSGAITTFMLSNLHAATGSLSVVSGMGLNDAHFGPGLYAPGFGPFTIPNDWTNGVYYSLVAMGTQANPFSKGGFGNVYVNDGIGGNWSEYYSTRVTNAPCVNGLNSNINLGQPFGFVHLVNPSAAYSVGGFAATATGVATNGAIMQMMNATAWPCTLVDEDASSTSTNRLKTTFGQNIVIPPLGTFDLRYDGNYNRWVVTGTSYQGTIPVSTAAPAAPTTGGTLFETAAGGLQHISSTGTIYGLAPAGSGSLNTQLQTFPDYVAVGRTVAVAGTVTLNVPIPSGHIGQLQISALCQCVVAGGTAALGDSFGFFDLVLAKNVGGTMTIVGGLPTAIFTKSDTSQAANTVTVTTGTNSINIVCTQVGATNTGTLDWQISVTGSIA